MRLRLLGAAAVVVVAAGSLTACRSNVGFAVQVQDHRYSESDISDYVTAQAEPVSQQISETQVVSVPAKSYVVDTLIVGKLEQLVVDSLPGRSLTAGELASVEKSVLAGKSAEQLGTSSGVRGFTASFYKVYLRARAYSAILDSLGQAAQQQNQQFDPGSIAVGLKMPVKVNPRYGTWNPKTLTFDSGSGAALPEFLKLKSDLGTTGTQPLTK